MSSTKTSDASARPEVTPFLDRDTNTISYVVKDPHSPACARRRIKATWSSSKATMWRATAIRSAALAASA